MSDWKPRIKSGIDLTKLDLNPGEGFLLSRMDGETPVGDLVRLTGLPESKVTSVLDRLAEKEVLEDAGPSDDGEDASGPGAHEWRRIFQTELKPLPEDQRVELAPKLEGNRLKALCHDPSSRVAKALLENEAFGLEHARLLARHHHTAVGLDALVRRPEFQRDLHVQRNLFRNSQVSATILQRIFARYRMSQVYQLTTSHDVSSKVRNLAKKAFRKKFSEGSSEERVRLILKTEGRCLALLIGVALGAKATALLARRPLHSTLLLRNLTRWPSTPPPVLRHMARQPAVRRSPQLAAKILQHPNAPSSLRRELS